MYHISVKECNSKIKGGRKQNRNTPNQASKCTILFALVVQRQKQFQIFESNISSLFAANKTKPNGQVIFFLFGRNFLLCVMKIRADFERLESFCFANTSLFFLSPILDMTRFQSSHYDCPCPHKVMLRTDQGGRWKDHWTSRTLEELGVQVGHVHSFCHKRTPLGETDDGESAGM